MKLKDGEAVHLAGLLIATCRPRTEAEKLELEAWIKRLQGGRQ